MFDAPMPLRERLEYNEFVLKGYALLANHRLLRVAVQSDHSILQEIGSKELCQFVGLPSVNLFYSLVHSYVFA